MADLPPELQTALDKAICRLAVEAVDDFLAAVTAFAHRETDVGRQILDSADQEIVAVMGVVACASLLEGRANITGELMNDLTQGFASEIRDIASKWSFYG